MYYDSHTHLNDDKLYPNWQVYFENFVKNGGKGFVNIGTIDERNQRAITICHQINNLLKQMQINDFFNCITIGYHPSYISEGVIQKNQFNEKISNLRKLYNENKNIIVGIGECGIDMHYEKETLNLQKEFFAMHLDLCKELNLPVVIHSRDDFENSFDILKLYKDLKIYFHCWGYGPGEIEKIKKTFPNFWIGFAGNVTYPKAINIKQSLEIVDLENILIETDAPYLSPQAIRGQINQPLNVKYIYDFVCSVKNIDIAKLSEIVKNNFLRLYDKKCLI